MNRLRLQVTFSHEQDLIDAANAMRKKGVTIVDAFTPFAVHGLDRAMGLKSSRLSWVCFVCGMCGFLGMLVFEHWTASISWPINIGGKPWNSLPSDIPVAFEAAVLLGGFSSVFALFLVSGLYPGKTPVQGFKGTTDNLFVIVLEENDIIDDLRSLEASLREYHPVAIQEDLMNARGIQS